MRDNERRKLMSADICRKRLSRKMMSSLSPGPMLVEEFLT